MSWTNRVHQPSRTPPLRQVQTAAQNLADQAGIAPGKSRLVFQIVTDAVILASALIGGTLGAVHLWKTLRPKRKEDHPPPESVGGNRSPPRRPGPRAIAAAGDRGGYEKDGGRFR